jgi:hypothetical protein
MGGGERGLPSGVGPGAAEQSTTANDRAGHASQNSTTVLPRPVHQRSLPYWLPQAWVRSITPPATGLDRCRRPRMAIWPTIPRSPKTCRHGGSS